MNRVEPAGFSPGLAAICGQIRRVRVGPIGGGEPWRAVLFSAQVDVPDEQPITFEPRITPKAAKALGVTIPQSILLRADEVIQ